MRKIFDVSGLEKNLNSSFYLGQEALRPFLPVALLACLSLLLLRQTANVNLYHVTKFSIYLSFTVHYNNTKIGRFTPILSVRIVLSCFYQHIAHFKNFSTWISRLPFAVNTKNKTFSHRKTRPLTMISLEDDLPRPSHIGQVSLLSFSPSKKVYLPRTIGRGSSPAFSSICSTLKK